MALFGIILGGGNYISALTLAILQGMAIAGTFLYQKCNAEKRKIYQRRAVVLTILWLEFLVCFAVSALAPGNAVRAESTWGYGPVSSIIHSLIQGVKYYEARRPLTGAQKAERKHKKCNSSLHLPLLPLL